MTAGWFSAVRPSTKPCRFVSSGGASFSSRWTEEVPTICQSRRNECRFLEMEVAKNVVIPPVTSGSMSGESSRDGGCHVFKRRQFNHGVRSMMKLRDTCGNDGPPTFRIEHSIERRSIMSKHFTTRSRSRPPVSRGRPAALSGTSGKISAPPTARPLLLEAIIETAPDPRRYRGRQSEGRADFFWPPRSAKADPARLHDLHMVAVGAGAARPSFGRVSSAAIREPGWISPSRGPQSRKLAELVANGDGDDRGDPYLISNSMLACWSTLTRRAWR